MSFCRRIDEACESGTQAIPLCPQQQPSTADAPVTVVVEDDRAGTGRHPGSSGEGTNVQSLGASSKDGSVRRSSRNARRRRAKCQARRLREGASAQATRELLRFNDNDNDNNNDRHLLAGRTTKEDDGEDRVKAAPKIGKQVSGVTSIELT